MTLEELIEIVSKQTNVDIKSKCRDTDHVLARAIYFDLAYSKLKLGSMSSIGKSVNRDHATVIHALRNVLPHIKKHYRVMHSHRVKLLNRFVFDEDYMEETAEERADKLTKQYSELKEKYDNILLHLQGNDNDELNQLVSSIRRVPEEKLSILKLRVDAMIRML